MPDKKVFVVTGANKGIGKEIVLSLAKAVTQPALIYVAARDKSRGTAAVAEMKQTLLAAANSTTAELEFLHLDISSEESIKAAVETVKAQGPGYVDVLVNNAGIAAKGDAFNADVARSTIDTNYYGTKHATLAFLPLIRDGGRIVNVSSMAGKLGIVDASLQAQFSDPQLTLDKLDALMESFISAVAADGGETTYKEKGWPRTTYGVSKLGLTAMTRVLARQHADVKAKGIFVAACCPGWCKTDMAGDRAPKSAVDGAKTPVMLATASSVAEWENGGYFTEEKPAQW
ncbi:Carbonyl reductase [NADPH] 3 [Geranomyces michiganensis]|nr:Carbonyl reductase [NADPH] 3 [Geranomyces michiganensis]